MTDAKECIQPAEHRFTIDRSEWLRGGGSASMLWRGRDKQLCCVGIYLRSLGLERYDLEGRVSAAEALLQPLPEGARWLVGAACSSDDGVELMRLNDSTTLLDREKQIAKLFASHGVKVDFDGE